MYDDNSMVLKISHIELFNATFFSPFSGNAAAGIASATKIARPKKLA